MRDVRAIVTQRGAGCDGRLPRQALRAPDESAASYGEVVWSWRRDPGAKLCGKSHAATGARKAASPGSNCAEVDRRSAGLKAGAGRATAFGG
jgi:hypothetical protein